MNTPAQSSDEYWSAKEVHAGVYPLSRHIEARDFAWRSELDQAEGRAQSAEARERYLMDKVRELESDARMTDIEVQELHGQVQRLTADLDAARALLREAERLITIANKFGMPPRIAEQAGLFIAAPPADSPAPPTLEHCTEEHCYHKGVLHSHRQPAPSPAPVEPDDKTKLTALLERMPHADIDPEACALLLKLGGIPGCEPPDNGPRDVWARLDQRLTFMEEALERHDYGGRIGKLTAAVAALEAWAKSPWQGWKFSPDGRYAATPAPFAEPGPFQFTGTCAACRELVSDGRAMHRECEAETAGPGPHAWREPHAFREGVWPNRSECSATTKSPNNESCGLAPGHPIHAKPQPATANDPTDRGAGVRCNKCGAAAFAGAERCGRCDKRGADGKRCAGWWVCDATRAPRRKRL